MRQPLSILWALLAAPALVAPAAAQSSAVVQQVGLQNLAEVGQDGGVDGPSQAQIRQIGAGGHVARLDQSGGTADVLQDGSGHVLAGLSGGLTDPTSAAVSADGSELVVRQEGLGHRAFVDQRDGSFARVTQAGQDNLVVLSQSGGAVARVSQDGTGNVARVTQSDF